MKRIFLCLSLAVCSLVYADRSDVWLASTVKVQRVELISLPDGGCAVSVRANFSNAAGVTTSELARGVEVAGSARTVCLDILNNKAPALFKADRGL